MIHDTYDTRNDELRCYETNFSCHYVRYSETNEIRMSHTRLRKRKYVPQSNTPFRLTELMCVWGGLLEYPRRPRHTRDIMTTYDKELVYIRCTRSTIQQRVVSTIFRATFSATFQHILKATRAWQGNSIYYVRRIIHIHMVTEPLSK